MSGTPKAPAGDLRVRNHQDALAQGEATWHCRQDFATLIENQVAVWQGQIKDHQERLGQAGAEARADHEKAVAGLRENAEQAGKLLHQVRQANEGAWKDMQTGTEDAFERLQKGWADALKRFG